MMLNQCAYFFWAEPRTLLLEHRAKSAVNVDVTTLHSGRVIKPVPKFLG